MAKCPFCGSEKTKIPTPYIDKFGDRIYSYCCLAQRNNDKYVESHTSRLTGDKPNIEEVSKW